MRAPAVLWFTGLSGAGKSTLAEAVIRALHERAVPTELLDGDAVRALSPTGFSRADRDAHVQRVGFLASRLEHHGVTVVCALISPYAGARARRSVDVPARSSRSTSRRPFEECERRDPKGLYARARRGEISSFTGVSDPYEPPSAPDLTIDTSHATGRRGPRGRAVEPAVARSCGIRRRLPIWPQRAVLVHIREPTMKRVVCLAIGVSLVASAVYAQGGPGGGQPVGLAAGMQAAYTRIKGLLMASADKLSEADYAFKPTNEIRGYGQLWGHVANFQYGQCAQAKGVPNPNQGNNLENRPRPPRRRSSRRWPTLMRSATTPSPR